MLELHSQSTLQFGQDVADKYIDDIDAALARLAEFPQSGPVFPGIRPQVRYLAYKRHRIMNDYDGNSVSVISVIHHARDVRRLL